MVRREGGTARLAAASLLGLAIAGALSFASSAVWASAALRADDLAGSASAFNTLGWVLQAVAGFGLAAHLLGTSALGLRARSVSLWLAGVGIASAAGFVVTGVLGSTSPGSASDLIGLRSYVLFSLWVLAMSYRLWRDAPATTTTPTAERPPAAAV
jgi:hypothetical protein